MPFERLIAAAGLSRQLGEEDWATVDCRFSLGNPERGRRDCLESPVPAAVYARLDPDLCGKASRGKTGGHPLLRRRFENLLKSVSTENAICYCGSGVTAAHNLFAIAYAGSGMGRLYGGSRSGWIADSARPVETGVR